MKENKTEKRLNKIKEKKSTKFFDSIKKRWLITGTKTALLVVIIITIFIGLNILMQKANLEPIDFSQDKLYTLTEESKERVKSVDKDVKIYFIGYDETNPTFELANKYKNYNEKITAEIVDVNARPDLLEKYGIERDSQSQVQAIIIECDPKSKVLTNRDLITTDTSTYETISIAEEKITTSIMSVASDRIPKVYFLEGYSEFSLNKNMNLLNMLLENEINQVETLNILSTGKIPEDCDTLVITTPSKDFDDVATEAIINYINSGRNILWLNAAQTQNKDLANVNKILSLYAIKPFDVGVIRETNQDNMLSDASGRSMPDNIIPKTQYSDILKDVYNSIGAVMVNATKINIDEDKLEEQKVEKQELLNTTEGAYFRINFNNIKDEKSEEEESKAFVVGAELKKNIKEADEENNQKEVVSKLIIFGENYFISDYPIVNGTTTPGIQYGKNKDVILNSLAYLVDRPEDIVARKSTGTVTYTATATQDRNIRIIIFIVPILIIIVGIVVWQIRRRKK